MPEKVELHIPAQPGSAASARGFLREHATLDSMRHAEADLLITELIGNVVTHSPGTDDLTVAVEHHTERGLVVAVTHPHPTPIDGSEAGVGFLLLERLSRAWGISHDGENLTVWFTLRTPGTTSIGEDVSDEALFGMMGDDPATTSDELVRRHTDLASSIARRYRSKGIDEDDLLQVANMALLKSIQRYDPSLGQLRAYAAATISGELKRFLRDRGWSVRVPRSLQEMSLRVGRTTERMAQTLNRDPEPHEIASDMGLTEEEVVAALQARQAYASSSLDKPSDETGASIMDHLEVEDLRLLMADDRLVVETAIHQLPERQQRILHLRFNEDMTQSEIASQIGISQMHVSRLLERALSTLRTALGDEPTED